MSLLNNVRESVRKTIRQIARAINEVSGGKITPNGVTYFGLLAHLPIAFLIGAGYPLYAGLLLIFFGLFDVLDGELARLQDKSSALGMFLDSTADRMKEILIYSGIIFYIQATTHTRLATFIVLGALGVSLLTTYMNAWGEVVLAKYKSGKNHVINKTFRSGLLGFEVRMFLLVAGLLSGKLIVFLSIILVFGSVTVWQRFSNIVQTLKNV